MHEIAPRVIPRIVFTLIGGVAVCTVCTGGAAYAYSIRDIPHQSMTQVPKWLIPSVTYQVGSQREYFIPSVSQLNQAINQQEGAVKPFSVVIKTSTKRPMFNQTLSFAMYGLTGQKGVFVYQVSHGSLSFTCVNRDSGKEYNFNPDEKKLYQFDPFTKKRIAIGVPNQQVETLLVRCL